MMDSTGKAVMPRMRDIVKAEAVDPNVGAALSTAALSVEQSRQPRHPLPEKRKSQTQH